MYIIITGAMLQRITSGDNMFIVNKEHKPNDEFLKEALANFPKGTGYADYHDIETGNILYILVFDNKGV